MITDNFINTWDLIVIDKILPSTNITPIRPLFTIPLQYTPESLKFDFESTYTTNKDIQDGAFSPAIQFKSNKVVNFSITATLHSPGTSFTRDARVLSPIESLNLLLKSMVPNIETRPNSIKSGSPPILLLVGPEIPLPFFLGDINGKLGGRFQGVTPVVLTKVDAALSSFQSINDNLTGGATHIKVDLGFIVVVLPEQKEDMNQRHVDTGHLTVRETVRQEARQNRDVSKRPSLPFFLPAAE